MRASWGALQKTQDSPNGSGSRGAQTTSLGVMPFANRSGVVEDDGLAYGMVEESIFANDLRLAQV